MRVQRCFSSSRHFAERFPLVGEQSFCDRSTMYPYLPTCNRCHFGSLFAMQGWLSITEGLMVTSDKLASWLDLPSYRDVIRDESWQITSGLIFLATWSLHLILSLVVEQGKQKNLLDDIKCKQTVVREIRRAGVPCCLNDLGMGQHRCRTEALHAQGAWPAGPDTPESKRVVREPRHARL